MKKDFDVVIIGAGPAGSIAAARLLQDRLSVLVLEKTEFPRFVIGESLLPQSMDYLEKAGLLKAVETQNFQLKTGVAFYHDNKICDFFFKDRFSEGWDFAYQVKRADFDHTLIKEVESKGAKVLFNATVTNVVTSKNQQTVTYTLANGEEKTVTCDFVIDASGYGRVLPRMFNLEKDSDSAPRGAIFSHVMDEKRSNKASENIFIYDFNDNKAWIWCIPFSDRTCSVGVVGDADLVKEFGENDGAKFRAMVNDFPGLNDRFKEAEYIFEPRQILNYAVSVEKMYGEGFVLCGNSTEFLDPVFSSGVTLAITSGYKAAELVIKQLNGESVDWENDYEKVVKYGVNVFRSYVEAWYSGDLHTIFFVEEGNFEFKKQICSVLAGYVWDETNPFARKHKTVLTTLAKVIRITNEAAMK
ncbi:MAG: NAD(P)/FAD-dependent oxidoreductase [Crocinitomicaceae bacterium]